MFFALACGGGITTGPSDAAEAFEWARVTPPPDATDLRFRGETGLDRHVQIQWGLPDLTAARAFTTAFECHLSPVQERRDNPFRRARPDDLEGWVVDAPEGSLACRTEAAEFHRSVRVDPLEDGTVRVQLWANTL